MSDPGETMQPEPGSAYERSDQSAERLAEGFAQHVERWARRLQAEDSATEPGDMPDPAQHPGAGAATRPPIETGFALLRHAAHQTSLATSNGHVCLMLSDLAPSPFGAAQSLSPSPSGGGLGWGQTPDALRQSLLSTRVVGTLTSPGSCPLILDEDGRLYLHRYFDYEVRLARRIMQAARTPPRTVSPAARDLLNTLFPPPKAGEVDWQKIAAALALRNTLTIISGGPGTGKTTTVVNLLACLLTQEPHSRIALAAPTGKAAARMTEAIRQRAGHLPEDLRAKLPTESFTIHRLLGANPGQGTFTHDAGNPLPYDALIVDEASMLDLALASRLLEAVPASARIILLGDKDQLAAVEAGAVFAELSADPTLTDGCRREIADLCGYAQERIAPPVPVPRSPLPDVAVWLTRNYRFPADSGIGRLARYINEGRANEAMALLRASRGSQTVGAVPLPVAGTPAAAKTRRARQREKDTASLSLFPGLAAPSAAPAAAIAAVPDAGESIRWLDPGQGDDVLDAILAGYAGYFETVRLAAGDVDAVFRAFNAFRVLCAVRDGPAGVDAFNEQVTRHARRVLASLASAESGSHWYVGRPVMVLRNDHVLKAFNGDIGIALPDGNGALAVAFPDGEAACRRVPVARMPEHETAYAMTIHKAQGTEFDAVLTALPHRASELLTRELLYTAITRARTQARIFATGERFVATVARRTQHVGGLFSRLRTSAGW
ncbi:MAG: exodeoxyribonuclease V subunit alpha [Ramlibacter sp.]